MDDTFPPVNIGISSQERVAVAEGLTFFLADTYTLYLKTHRYHWNVVGPMFQTLHLLFEEQYNELALAVDAVAERIRTLGFFVPANYVHFLEMTDVDDDDADSGEVSSVTAEDMVRRLVVAHETVAATGRSVFEVADSAGDHGTCDLLTQRLNVHEKAAWMLRSLLE